VTATTPSSNGSNGHPVSTTPTPTTSASPTGHSSSSKKSKKSETSKKSPHVEQKKISVEHSRKSTEPSPTRASPLPPIPPLKISSPSTEPSDKSGTDIGAPSPAESLPSPSSQEMRVIPRLVDSAGQAAVQRGKDSSLDPSTWSVEEVAQFLQINECTSLVDAFTKQVRQKLRTCKICCLSKNRLMYYTGNVYKLRK
jgi:hypothetical protein